MMQGRRVDWKPDRIFGMEPGDYCKAPDGAWWLMPPKDGPIRIAPGDGWALVEHEDGTLTVGPTSPEQSFSIWINKTGTPPGWHGYLTAGVWSTV